MSYSVFPFLAYGKPMTFFWFGECIFFRYDGTNICQAEGPNKMECPINCLLLQAPVYLHCQGEACGFLMTVLCDFGQGTYLSEFSFSIYKMEIMELNRVG